jgi:hypothetical protein
MALVISAALLWAMPLSRAAEPDTTAPAQPSAASEAPSSALGPLSPVRREPPAAAQSSSKPATAATKPTITMPAPAPTPSADNATSSASAPPAAAKPQPQPQKTEHGTSGMPAASAPKPQPKQAEHAISPAPAPAPAPKTARAEQKKPEPKQADEATPPRPHRKPPSTRSETAVVNAPGERRPTMIERRDRVVEIDRMPPRERVYREEYSWSDEAPVVRRRAAPYPPPPVYADEPEEIGPRPFAPPWSYRYRSFAWGPYPGMPGPRFGPPY